MLKSTDEFVNPAVDRIGEFLQTLSSIAVVGLSPKPNRPSHQVAAALQQFGYRIFPVRPAVDEILGEPVVRDLYALKETPDLVDVFRAPEHVDPIVDACIEIGIKAIWLQDGVVNHAAALRAQAAGMFVVMDRCIYRDYKDLVGSAN